MSTRDCECDHPFPFCCCAIGYTGETLAYHSRVASAIIGWPTLDYDAEAVAEHNAKMAEARSLQGYGISPYPSQAENDAAARRAAKPRIPLGVKIGSAECVPCRQASSSSYSSFPIHHDTIGKGLGGDGDA